jgi:hypothetical protein
LSILKQSHTKQGLARARRVEAVNGQPYQYDQYEDRWPGVPD